MTPRSAESEMGVVGVAGGLTDLTDWALLGGE
jgi:hypothetical protein